MLKNQQSQNNGSVVVVYYMCEEMYLKAIYKK